MEADHGYENEKVEGCNVVLNFRDVSIEEEIIFDIFDDIEKIKTEQEVDECLMDIVKWRSVNSTLKKFCQEREL